MNFVNSWRSIGKSKQTDKVNITFRIAAFTLIEVKWDKSKGELRLILFNFGFEKEKGDGIKEVVKEAAKDIKKAKKRKRKN